MNIEAPKTKKKLFTIRLPVSIYKELLAIAKQSDVSVAQVVRALIDQALKK